MTPIGEQLLNAPLISRAEFLARREIVPKERGCYAWFFRQVPPSVTHSEITRDGLTLLYVGIAPSRETSRQTLRTRIWQHFCGPSRSSTLRRTLAMLLEDESRFPIVRGRDRRPKLDRAGEEWLNAWLDRNASVAFVACVDPWQAEKGLLRNYSCPLNISDNFQHQFYSKLREIKATALNRAVIAV